MADYLAEMYLSTAPTWGLEDAAARARAAARELGDEGIHVRHLRSVFLSDDETCFHFFEAPSIDAVREVVARARLDCQRIGPVVTAEDGRGET